MISPVICLARNNLHLTKKAVKSILAQDIPVELLLIDNASTDGTHEWTQTRHFHVMHFHEQIPVAAAWNAGLNMLFGMDPVRKNPNPAEYCLVANNDVELRPDTYRWLIKDGGGFVTAVGSNDHSKMTNIIEQRTEEEYRRTSYSAYPIPDPAKKRPHPDFSCFLIRKEVWEQVGVFDEKFEGAMCEDWDYHVRLFKAGIKAECLDLPFYHYGSATVKLADPLEAERIRVQADKNREYFRQKWGMAGGSEAYYKYFNSSPPPKSD